MGPGDRWFGKSSDKKGDDQRPILLAQFTPRRPGLAPAFTDPQTDAPKADDKKDKPKEKEQTTDEFKKTVAAKLAADPDNRHWQIPLPPGDIDLDEVCLYFKRNGGWLARKGTGTRGERLLTLDSTAPPPADKGPATPLGAPAAPPADKGGPAAPPGDKGGPAAPLGAPAAPPADKGGPAAPPADKGGPAAPPADKDAGKKDAAAKTVAAKTGEDTRSRTAFRVLPGRVDPKQDIFTPDSRTAYEARFKPYRLSSVDASLVAGGTGVLAGQPVPWLVNKGFGGPGTWYSDRFYPTTVAMGIDRDVLLNNRKAAQGKLTTVRSEIGTMFSPEAAEIAALESRTKLTPTDQANLERYKARKEILDSGDWHKASTCDAAYQRAVDSGRFSPTELAALNKIKPALEQIQTTLGLTDLPDFTEKIVRDLGKHQAGIDRILTASALPNVQKDLLENPDWFDPNKAEKLYQDLEADQRSGTPSISKEQARLLRERYKLTCELAQKLGPTTTPIQLETLANDGSKIDGALKATISTRETTEITALEKLAKESPLSTADASKLARLKARQNLLADERWLGDTKDAQKALTRCREAVHEGTALFTTTELDLLAKHAKAVEGLETSEAAIAARTTRLAALDTAAASTPGIVRPALNAFLKRAGQNGVIGNFVKAGGTYFLATEADRITFEMMSGGKWGESLEPGRLTIPAAFLYGKSGGQKALFMGGAVAADAAIDYGVHKVIGSPQPEQVDFLRPRLDEAALTGAALMYPAKDWRVNMVGVLGAYAYGRGMNLYDGPSNPLAKIRYDAFNALWDDGSKRTAESMNDAIDKCKKLDFASLQLLSKDIMQPNRQSADDEKLWRRREIVILHTALAEKYLESGSLIPPFSAKPEFLFKGEGIDFGLTAETALKSAKAGISHTLSAIDERNGKVDCGKEVTLAEKDQLKAISERITKLEERIYGEHDVKGIVDSFRPYAFKNPTQAEATVADIKQMVEQSKMQERQTGKFDAQFRARLYEQLAICYLARAGNDLQYSDAGVPATIKEREANIALSTLGERVTRDVLQKEIGGDGTVLDVLFLAERLDPKNPDLPALKAYAQKLTDAANRAKK